MRPEDVARSYDELAEHWQSDAFPSTNGIAQHERALAFLSRKETALDIGCGSNGRIVELLIHHGFEVEGVDISKRMIELAKRRHPDVPFHHADIRTWDGLRHYDLISAWDSIWHLPLIDQAPTLRRILDALRPGGVLIFTTGGLDDPSEKSDSAMGPEMYYSVLGIPGTLELIAAADCVCRHLEYDQLPERHLYIIAQKCKADGDNLTDVDVRAAEGPTPHALDAAEHVER